jgi:hypothetical protein
LWGAGIKELNINVTIKEDSNVRTKNTQ